MAKSNILSTINTHLAKQRTPEKVEFGNSSLKFLLKRIGWRFASQEKRTQDLNNFINGLSDGAFDQNIDMILLQVNTSKKECENYVSDTSQMKSVVKRLPRLGNHSTKVLEYIKKARRKYRLD